MADQKLTQLDAATTLADDDLVYVVDDVAGTPGSKKLTGANLKAAVGGAATAKNSVEVDAGDIQLVGDVAAPGNDKVYGTTSAGVRGWKDDPAGSGGGGADEAKVTPTLLDTGRWHGPADAVGTYGTGPYSFMNYLYLCPFQVPVPCNLTAAGVNITTAGDSGTEIRIAVWATTDGAPATLLGQGVIDASTTGLKTLVFDPPLEVDGWFYVGHGPQGTGTVPAVRRHNTTMNIARHTDATYVENIARQAIRIGPVAGAATSNPTPEITNSGAPSLVEVKLEKIV